MPFTAAAVAAGGGGGAAAATGLTLGAKIAIAASIAGTAVSVIGQRQQSKAAEDAAKANAAALQVQAQQEEAVTKEEISRLETEKKRRTSRLRVLAANAGIDLVGTPLLQEEGIAGEIEEEKQFAGTAGRQRQFGLQSRAVGQKNVARNIRRASPFRTGATILTGVSRTAELRSSLA